MGGRGKRRRNTRGKILKKLIKISILESKKEGEKGGVPKERR